MVTPLSDGATEAVISPPAEVFSVPPEIVTPPPSSTSAPLPEARIRALVVESAT